jgi:tRNA threonylcarbamoyladenosine biosynthesis protein TsaE
MKPWQYVSEGPAETFRIGIILGELLGEGDIVALTGELGAGKTCLTQGIAKGLGVPESYQVTSPTFTLANEYPGRLRLNHLDVYRLSGSQDLQDLGYEEFFFGSGVTVIEWAEKIQDVIPEKSIRIVMAYLDPNRRSIEIAVRQDRMAVFSKALEEGGF